MKLYETYQEEWQRLERLGMQLGPRRKSVLNLEAFGSPQKSSLPENTTPERSPSATPSKDKESNDNK